MSEGEGKPPVVVVSDETSVTSGTAVQEKLIAAARVFSDLLSRLTVLAGWTKCSTKPMEIPR